MKQPNQNLVLTIPKSRQTLPSSKSFARSADSETSKTDFTQSMNTAAMSYTSLAFLSLTSLFLLNTFVCDCSSAIPQKRNRFLQQTQLCIPRDISMLHAIPVDRRRILYRPHDPLLHHLVRRISRQFQVIKARMRHRKVLIRVSLRHHPHNLKLRIIPSSHHPTASGV